MQALGEGFMTTTGQIRQIGLEIYNTGQGQKTFHPIFGLAIHNDARFDTGSDLVLS
jgi:hypothetical protein